MEDALLAARNCNIRGQKAIWNCIGEDYTEQERVNQAVKEYSTLLERLYSDEIEGSISIKLTQPGL